MQIDLPDWGLSARLTIRPSKFSNDGGHGQARVLEMRRPNRTRRQAILSLSLMVRQEKEFAREPAVKRQVTVRSDDFA